MTRSGRFLVLCADDFGLAPGVNDAIVELAEIGRLSAISCMAITSGWPGAARKLEACIDRCDIGLHLTLTDYPPLSAMPTLARSETLPSLKRLMSFAYAGVLRHRDVAAEIAEEVARQWDAFTQTHGRLPDFIDGHQHVHLLPGVRERVVERIRRCGLQERPWLRVCWEPWSRIAFRRIAVGKTALLAALSRPLRQAAASHGLATNDSFRGVYGFEEGADYPAMFRRFLAGAAQRPLIMCHPGFVDERLRGGDAIAAARQHEYAYFSSPGFAVDLSRAGFRLARYRDFGSS